MDKSKSNNKISKKDSSKQIVDKKLMLKAIKVVQRLHQEEKASSKDLFELSRKPFLYLNFLLNKLPEVSNYRDIQLTLPSSIYNLDQDEKRLFIMTNEVKKNNKELLKAFKGNWKFISYEKLKKNFKEYKDKRALLKTYDLFFCERSLVGNLKKALGTKFFTKKKYPFPVSLSEQLNEEGLIEEEKFRAYLSQLVDNVSYMHLGEGTELSIKVGRVEDMKELDILKNCLSCFKQLVTTLKQYGLTLKNIRRVFIKGEKTQSLPVYSYLTDEEKEIARAILNESI